jgi:excisionase family DNA binding protein
MESLLSPRELADALGVSESSIKRWVDGGELAALRTAGGHRRIARSEAVRFARARGALPLRPELLAFGGARAEEAGLDEAHRSAAFHHALLDDDRPRALGLLNSAFLAGTSIASICDGPIRFALERIGELWMHDSKGILYEHRATDVCMHALGFLRNALPPPAPDAPVAVGSAAADDPYLLPSMMCAITLAELGVRDVNLGPRTPVTTTLAAVETYRPLLVWHTASVGGEDVAPLASGIRRFVDSSASPEIRLLVGGRAIAGTSLPTGVAALATMGELQAFARALLPAASRAIR